MAITPTETFKWPFSAKVNELFFWEKERIFKDNISKRPFWQYLRQFFFLFINNKSSKKIQSVNFTKCQTLYIFSYSIIRFELKLVPYFRQFLIASPHFMPHKIAFEINVNEHWWFHLRYFWSQHLIFDAVKAFNFILSSFLCFHFLFPFTNHFFLKSIFFVTKQVKCV